MPISEANCSQQKLDIVFSPIPIYDLPENTDVLFPVTRRWRKRDPSGRTIVRQELKGDAQSMDQDSISAPEEEDVVTREDEEGDQDNKGSQARRETQNDDQYQSEWQHEEDQEKAWRKRGHISQVGMAREGFGSSQANRNGRSLHNATQLNLSLPSYQVPSVNNSTINDANDNSTEYSGLGPIPIAEIMKRTVAGRSYISMKNGQPQLVIDLISSDEETSVPPHEQQRTVPVAPQPNLASQFGRPRDMGRQTAAFRPRPTSRQTSNTYQGNYQRGESPGLFVGQDEDDVELGFPCSGSVPAGFSSRRPSAQDNIGGAPNARGNQTRRGGGIQPAHRRQSRQSTVEGQPVNPGPAAAVMYHPPATQRQPQGNMDHAPNNPPRTATYQPSRDGTSVQSAQQLRPIGFPPVTGMQQLPVQDQRSMSNTSDNPAGAYARALNLVRSQHGHLPNDNGPSSLDRRSVTAANPLAIGNDPVPASVAGPDATARSSPIRSGATPVTTNARPANGYLAKLRAQTNNGSSAGPNGFPMPFGPNSFVGDPRLSQNNLPLSAPQQRSGPTTLKDSQSQNVRPQLASGVHSDGQMNGHNNHPNNSTGLVRLPLLSSSLRHSNSQAQQKSVTKTDAAKSTKRPALARCKDNEPSGILDDDNDSDSSDDSIAPVRSRKKQRTTLTSNGGQARSTGNGVDNGRVYGNGRSNNQTSVDAPTTQKEPPGTQDSDELSDEDNANISFTVKRKATRRKAAPQPKTTPKPQAVTGPRVPRRKASPKPKAPTKKRAGKEFDDERMGPAPIKWSEVDYLATLPKKIRRNIFIMALRSERSIRVQRGWSQVVPGQVLGVNPSMLRLNKGYNAMATPILYSLNEFRYVLQDSAVVLEPDADQPRTLPLSTHASRLCYLTLKIEAKRTSDDVYEAMCRALKVLVDHNANKIQRITISISPRVQFTGTDRSVQSRNTDGSLEISQCGWLNTNKEAITVLKQLMPRFFHLDIHLESTKNFAAASVRAVVDIRAKHCEDEMHRVITKNAEKYNHERLAVRRRLARNEIERAQAEAVDTKLQNLEIRTRRTVLAGGAYGVAKGWFKEFDPVHEERRSLNMGYVEEEEKPWPYYGWLVDPNPIEYRRWPN